MIGAGAKMLGPMLIGDGAKIGSNAVVVRDVPAGATAVGIPARLVTADEQDRREAQAAKIGFSQYAIAADMNDPVVQAIHRCWTTRRRPKPASTSWWRCCSATGWTAATPRRRPSVSTRRRSTKCLSELLGSFS